MRLRDVKVGMMVVYNGKLAIVDELLNSFSIKKWNLTLRIKLDGYSYLVNHRELRPYVEPNHEPVNQSPAVGTLEWAKGEASKGRELTLRNNKIRWRKNGDKWEVNMMNGEGWEPALEIFCEEGWNSHDPTPVKPTPAVDSPPWNPTIRLPTDPTEAAIRVIEHRIAKVRRESIDKICALESTIEELRKGWKP